ncbi:SGNH/GDSL hydrolase family protein [Virgibacillus doumboii]|uniref:SGNH/GDSL hydrolase family protein n=1 Tax=Virgibacillus doumboii TaxID=2697503 RepID=UPI0013E06AB6|nr:SGNH/GDSL hydrolase family protein [Virgibacillus doumboii]
MKRRYIFIILGILLIGFASVLFVDQPETELNVTKNKQTETEKETDTTPNQETEKTEDAPSEEEKEAKEPVTQFQDIIGDAIQKTIDFFTGNKTHIVAIGDSLTQGVGDDVVDGGYVGILDKTLNKEDEVVTFENYGKRGNRSSQLLQRLEKKEIENSIRQADIVLITIGANDIMKVMKENITDLNIKDFTQERTAFKERLKNIFDKINSLNDDTEIYLVGFYNPFEKYFKDIKELNMIVENWNSTGKKVTGQYDNVSYIPTADLFSNANTDLFADDNFHPNHRGYQLMAERILEHITH